MSYWLIGVGSVLWVVAWTVLWSWRYPALDHWGLFRPHVERSNPPVVIATIYYVTPYLMAVIGAAIGFHTRTPLIPVVGSISLGLMTYVWRDWDIVGHPI